MSLAESFADFEVATRRDLAQMEHALTSRLAELSTALAREIERRERTQSERLNQIARRLRMAESAEEWRSILEEGATPYARRVAVFMAADVAEAPAFATAIHSKDTVITLRAPSELTEEIAIQLGEPLSQRCYLFPILAGEEVCAVLYAEDPAKPPRDALELLAVLANNTMPVPPPPEPVVEPEAEPAPELIQIEPAVAAGPPVLAQESMSVELPLAEEAIHGRARRFARLQVARLILFEPKAVESGRQNGSLYVNLKGLIDSGREQYRQEFLSDCPSMADYLHQELVRTLANDDLSKLGSEYPGALC